ncbi:hypothetical protein [Pelagicoccus sp. SDUM812003]|uniref:hypothetical protein n=1 Tax=Pelagicoccus sp. SDUM812003 TaxID=3041267 RepID=UPI00280E1542|nr:hypothetical protein [Pelagicoccus sp. SDUM812003]MDQ8205725.1 hypothetical protein [Pelagicoccus sp. SDUM812003]
MIRIITFLAALASASLAISANERSKAEFSSLEAGKVVLTLNHWNISEELQFLSLRPSPDQIHHTYFGPGALYGKLKGYQDWIRIEPKVSRPCGFGLPFDTIYVAAKPTHDPKDSIVQENILTNDHYPEYGSNEESNSVTFLVVLDLNLFTDRLDAFLASYEDFRFEYSVYSYDDEQLDFVEHHKTVTDPFEIKNKLNQSAHTTPTSAPR